MSSAAGERPAGQSPDGAARLGVWRAGTAIAAPFLGLALLIALPGLTGVLAAVLSLALCPLVLLTAARGRLLRSVVVILLAGYALVVIGILTVEVWS